MTTPIDDTDQTSPFERAAWTYRSAGWTGTIPLPANAKKLALTGYTGRNGLWPSGPDVQDWITSGYAVGNRRYPAGNIALRLPPDVIGIDVDNYDGKQGMTTLVDAMVKWGPLPPTWTSTARAGESGIRFYRVPEGLKWPGDLGDKVGPHVEIVQVGHRYAVVAPSVHPNGLTYRWYTPDRIPSTAPPNVDDLPDLPDTWIEGLTAGQQAEHVEVADLSDEQAGIVVEDMNHGDQPCRRMTSTLNKLTADLATGSAHEALRRLLSLVRLGEQGHHGLHSALTTAHTAFLAEVTRGDRRGATRDRADADAEWRRSLAGAIRRVVGNPTVAAGEYPPDPCADPFADLIDHTPSPTPTNDVRQVGEPNSTNVGATGARDETYGSTEQRTSWWPVDLAAILTGDNPEPPPTILTRDDGQALFYAGKVNGLLGESESGKTWIAHLAVAQQLDAGHRVAILDFEDTAPGAVARLRALGVPDEQMLERLHYVGPDQALDGVAAGDLADLLTHDHALIILDGVNAAMALLGMESNSTTDATAFSQRLLKPLTRNGAAVLTVDHVAKNKEARAKGGIGSQAKRAMTTGCSIMVDVTKPFGRGKTGRLMLTVDKDRPGHVRGFAAYASRIGTAVLDSDLDTGAVTVHIEAASEQASEDRAPFTPTTLMERVSTYLASTAGGASKTAILKDVKGDKVKGLPAAIERLVEQRCIERVGDGTSTRYVHLNHYRAPREDPFSGVVGSHD